MILVITIDHQVQCHTGLNFHPYSMLIKGFSKCFRDMSGGGMSPARFKKVSKAMCLCVAYASCFGGSATLIGTGAVILTVAQVEA